MSLDEAVAEEAALPWLNAVGYAVLPGPDIAAGESGAGPSDPSYRDVVLARRFRQALMPKGTSIPLQFASYSRLVPAQRHQVTMGQYVGGCLFGSNSLAQRARGAQWS